MQKYKDLINNIHELESSEFEYLLPVGSVAITDAEAAALLAPSPAEQAAIDEAKRIDDIKIEAVSRINILFPSIRSVDQIEFFAEFWLSITPASRNATVDFQQVIDIYSVTKAAITDGVTVVGDIVWP